MTGALHIYYTSVAGKARQKALLELTSKALPSDDHCNASTAKGVPTRTVS